jgi:1-deoxy-D-xylulose-5-phosphate synthase
MILEHIRSPADLQKVPRERLGEVASEIRRKILDTVIQNGGHLGSGMGVVELTIALHYLYDFTRDRLFLDTGHQCYPHKLLTGRYERFDSLRRKGGISGFPNIDESPFDLMTSGHAGTAISMGLGACMGHSIGADPRHTVVVVGDASIVSGISFEALNAAGHREQDLLVILNDNEQSIGKSVGSLAKMLSRIRMSKMHSWAMDKMQKVERLVASIPVIGERVDKSMHELVEQVKHALIPATMFEELGFRYFGIYDGHDLDEMLEVLGNVKAQPGIKLLHVLTVKGKGVAGCEEDPLALHGAKPGDPLHLDGESGCAVEKVEPPKVAKKAKKYDFAKCFSEAVLEEADRNPDVVAITAGMPDGTGLVPFRQKYPDRFFNVGIAEQHGVAFASGLTITGRRPVFTVYSTFMQRGFDQVFQEVALQRNPVVLMLSHGGLAGEDGATHHGLFDIAILRALPGITLMAARDGAELQEMFYFAIRHDAPSAVRYPKAATEAPGREVAPIELGKGEILQEGSEVALLGYGPMAHVALEAAQLLEREGIHCLVANARFARPLDEDLLLRLTRDFRFVIPIEEAAITGGFGSAVLEWVSQQAEVRARIYPMGVPSRFIEHGSRSELLEELGLTPDGVRNTVLRLTREAAQVRTATY